MASRRRHIGAQLSNAVYRLPEAATLFVLTAVGTAAAIAVMVALKAQNWPGQRRRRRDLTCSSSGSRISTATTALAAATSVASSGGGGGGDSSGNSSGNPSSVGTSQQPAPVPPPTGELDSRFFADTDETGLARCSLRLLDCFLSWGCGRHLLGLGLFPDAKEITESMACLQAATEHLPETVRLADSDVVALVIGDGRTPRTAALLAMRSKWSVISIDPALTGLLPDGDTACAATAVGVLPPKELRSARLLEQEQAEGPAVRRRQLRADLRGIDRLHLCDAKVQDATVILSDNNSGSTATAAATTAAAAAAADPAAGPSIRLTLPHGGKVVVILPHAHVTPDEALTCLRFEGSFGTHPVALISLIQIPCCAYVYHNTCLGLQPNVEFLDPRICAIARCVRVWRDVSSQFDFAASARRAGVALGRRTRAARDSELQAAKRRAKRVHSEAREARRLKRQQRRGVVDGGPGGSRRPKLQPLVV